MSGPAATSGAASDQDVLSALAALSDQDVMAGLRDQQLTYDDAYDFLPIEPPAPRPTSATTPGPWSTPPGAPRSPDAPK